MENQTIVSQATPLGQSSVAVIRISGPNSFNIAKKLTGTKKTRTHHEIALLLIKNSEGVSLDRGLFTFFVSPNSYTGEDIVEISCHGNQLVVGIIINRCIKLGARIAEPGEYTKRAFLNNKVSLSQAESVGALISSKSEEAIIQNLKNIEGGSSKTVVSIKNSLVKALSNIEHELDVSEYELFDDGIIEETVKLIENNILECNKLLGSFAAGTAYSSGFRVVIVGRPNVGKSTLMNALVGINKSITSSEPGTTRDVITHEVTLGGLPVTLLDTAGIRETKNEIEAEGVSRATGEIDRASAIISLFCYNIEPIENIKLTNQISVFTKCDLKKDKGPFHADISVSAKTGSGIEELKNLIIKTLAESVSHSGDVFINTERQRQSILNCRHALLNSIEPLKNNESLFEITAHELRAAIDCLSSFLGETTTDEILDSVFSNFCVGK